MMGKTHIAVGIAAAYIFTQPKTVEEFAIATIGGSIGGVMADVDVKIDKSNKYAAKASLDALYGELLAIAISISSFVAVYYTKGNLISNIFKHWQQSLVGILLFIILTVFGKLSKHRDKTHSVLALLLFSLSVCLIDLYIGLAFSIGYGSHLIIDLLNKSPIRLLYPAKKGLCLKFMYADRTGNELLLIASVSIIIFYIFFRSSLGIST